MPREANLFASSSGFAVRGEGFAQYRTPMSEHVLIAVNISCSRAAGDSHTPGHLS
jgi:hypothetical protein